MFKRFLDWMERRGSYRMISREGRPYMERYYLLSVAGRALFLHRFWGSDPDGTHCHPWTFIVMIIRGAYFEETLDGLLTYCAAGRLRFSQAERLHAVRIPPSLEGKVWTLFAHGKRWRDWGFVAGPGEPWRSAKELGLQDEREMTGWLFPRFK